MKHSGYFSASSSFSSSTWYSSEGKGPAELQANLAMNLLSLTTVTVTYLFKRLEGESSYTQNEPDFHGNEKEFVWGLKTPPVFSILSTHTLRQNLNL